jgi:tetratricopeptide (TPR) repeat protein
MSAGADAAEQRAAHLNGLGRHADAAQLAREGLTESPGHPGLLCELAQALYLEDRSAEALEVASAALGADPGSERAHRLRALTLSDLGRHEEALAAAETARAMLPDHPYPARVTARVLWRAGRLRDAYAEALRYVDLDPQNAAAHCLVGDLLDALREPRHARRAYQRALELDPQNAIARNNLAVLDLRSGFSRNAMRGFMDAGQLDPKLSLVLPNVRAVLWNVAGRLRIWLLLAAIAIGVLGAVLQVHGGSPWAVRGLALLVLLAGSALVYAKVRDLPRSTLPVVRAALRSDVPLLITYLGTALMVLLLLAAVVTGTTWVLAPAVWLCLGLGVLAMVSGALRRMSAGRRRP